MSSDALLMSASLPVGLTAFTERLSNNKRMGTGYFFRMKE